MTLAGKAAQRSPDDSSATSELPLPALAVTLLLLLQQPLNGVGNQNDNCCPSLCCFYVVLPLLSWLTLLLLLLLQDAHLSWAVVSDLPAPLCAVQRVRRLLQIKLDMCLAAASTESVHWRVLQAYACSRAHTDGSCGTAAGVCHMGWQGQEQCCLCGRPRWQWLAQNAATRSAM
jgi:hypothetical protein